MNFTLFITVLLTAVTLVVAAYVIAKLIGPRSYNPVKVHPLPDCMNEDRSTLR